MDKVNQLEFKSPDQDWVTQKSNEITSKAQSLLEMRIQELNTKFENTYS